MSIQVRKFFNWSFLCLTFCGLLILFNVNISKNLISSNTESFDSFYVVDSRKDNFGNKRLTILLNNHFYELENNNLSVGREYRAIYAVRYFSFSDNVFENYFLSKGVKGEVQIISGIEINKNCDLFCKSASFVSKSKQNLSTKVSNFTCHDFYPVIKDLYYSETKCNDISALILGLTYGDTSSMNKETKDVIRKFGLSHVISVSGFQVVFISSFIEIGLRKLKIKSNYRIAISCILLFWLGVYAGFQPPIIRALFSILIFYFATFFGRRCSRTRALIYSAFLMLILNPFYLFNISFQLSFLATFALIKTQYSNIYLNYILASVNAFLYTLPLIIGISGEISPIGVIVNILILNTLPLITYFCILGLVPILGDFFLVLVNIILLLFLNLLFENSYLFDTVKIDTFDKYEIIWYYLILFIFNSITKFLLNKNESFNNKNVNIFNPLSDLR
jgi:ComEC/Rec2-related protein